MTITTSRSQGRADDAPDRVGAPDRAPTPVSGERVATRRTYLMCEPRYFAVRYTINPWMDPALPVDRDRAVRQWCSLVATYRRLGHQVQEIEPIDGLPDMVFAANGATVAHGRVYAAKFKHAERADEAPAYLAWLKAAGFEEAVRATVVNEGEGDLLVVGERLLAGTGFRTEPAAHAEAAAALDLPVVSLELIDPCYYHLDTALCVLDAGNIAYFPGAFSPASQDTLREMFPDAVIADADDAAVFGLNAVSDGRHVVLAAQAVGLAQKLKARGYDPVPVDMSELRKSGGGPKCCTLELRS